MAPLKPRERIAAAIEFREPDRLPLRIYPAPGGLYEHGQKLVDLTRECGHDFGDLFSLALPTPPAPEDFDEDGRYHVIRTDEWGTTWEYRIYGVWGHPIAWPLADLSALGGYTPPPHPPASGPDVDAGRLAIVEAKETYFTLGGGGLVFERLHSIRRFEDVLMDLVADTPKIHRITDMIVEDCLAYVQRSLAMDVDAVTFGDDYGTQQAMLISPETWRRFFRPRYAALFDPVRRAGKRIFYHVCGEVTPILEDLAELGVGVIWPQLTAFDVPWLARRCRDLGMCVELHPDRGGLMQRATPGEVRDYLHRLLDTFGTMEGGSWLYIEVDPGFPYENVEALFQVAMEARA